MGVYSYGKPNKPVQPNPNPKPPPKRYIGRCSDSDSTSIGVDFGHGKAAICC